MDGSPATGVGVRFGGLSRLSAGESDGSKAGQNGRDEQSGGDGQHSGKQEEPAGFTDQRVRLVGTGRRVASWPEEFEHPDGVHHDSKQNADCNPNRAVAGHPQRLYHATARRTIRLFGLIAHSPRSTAGGKSPSVRCEACEDGGWSVLRVAVGWILAGYNS